MNETNNGGKIPLVIGVTGHLNLREQDRETLKTAVRQEIGKLRERCPHTPAVMLCALARGADLLCADAAEELGLPLRAVLPMERAEYEKDFPPEDLARLAHHLERAEKVYVAPAAEENPGEESREFLYRQAGIHIAEHSHVLLALWDGKEGRTGGTADTVNVTMLGKWQPRRGAASRCPENAAVIHILTPREGEVAGKAGEVRVLGNGKAMQDILAKTEEFNMLAEGAETEGYALLPKDAGEEPGLRGMECLYHAADSLSLRFAKQYGRILAGLAGTGTLLTMAFLLYDEESMISMILLCGAMLICAVLLSGRAKRTACHRRYIEYRALAEAMRVQMSLRYAGSGIEAQRLMTWTQQAELAWILCAVCAMNAQQPPEKIRDIRECWVRDQQEYHRKAGLRTGKKDEGNNRLLRILLLCSVAAYLVTLAFELLCGGLGFRPVIRAGDPEKFRTVMKIVLGTLSAGGLFLGGYYGKMSLGRQSSDYGKMETFFRIMSERIETQGQTESLLEMLAREELAENGSWCSYRREDTPELEI